MLQEILSPVERVDMAEKYLDNVMATGPNMIRNQMQELLDSLADEQEKTWLLGMAKWFMTSGLLAGEVLQQGIVGKEEVLKLLKQANREYDQEKSL